MTKETDGGFGDICEALTETKTYFFGEEIHIKIIKAVNECNYYTKETK